jgi:hypothetical protein
MSERDAPQAEWTTFADARRRKFTMALALTPAERLAWLERAIEMAVRAGALPRRRE